MAKVVRKHGVSMLLGALVIIFGLTTLVLVADPFVRPAAATTTGSDELEPLDPYEYGQIQKLRERLCLTNRDLAAMACDQEQAEAVLLTVRNWYEANAASFAEVHQQERLAAARFRRALQKIRIGPRGYSVEAQMPSLKAAAVAASQTVTSAYTAADTAVRPHLRSDQLAIRDAALANGDLPSRYRYAQNVTESQARLIRRHSTIGTPLVDSENILSLQQQDQMQAVRCRMVAYATAVEVAHQRILAIHDDWRFVIPGLIPEPK